MNERPVCPICKGSCYIDTPALKFLHERAHAEPFDRLDGLRQLPFILYERAAKIMEDFARSELESYEKLIRDLKDELAEESWKRR